MITKRSTAPINNRPVKAVQPNQQATHTSRDNPISPTATQNQPGPDLAGGGLGPSHRRRRPGARGLPFPTTPPKSRKIFFFRANNVKFGHFPDKCRVKFGHFVNFTYIISGKNVLPPPNLTELLPYAYGPVLPVQ